MEEDLIIEIWDVFKEYVPEKNREVAANQYVDFLLGKDVDISVLEALTGFDQHLDEAIELVVGEHKQEEGYEEEEDWDYREDDED